MRFRINKPHVINEIIDGEVVILNLDTGNYYSMDKAGADIWGLIEGDAGVGEIVEEIATRYAGKREDIEDAVDTLIKELIEEHLIVSVDGSGSEGDVVSAVRDKSVNEKSLPEFKAPLLHKYSDMQELLLLDPIHDVGESGWPGAEMDPSANKQSSSPAKGRNLPMQGKFD
ncbi:MAG TPA: PqqD family protein [Nitrospirae bacterium]|nr:PqqD family protein [Nitrospirota bacterium]